MGKLNSIFRSDELVHLRELAERWPDLGLLLKDSIQIHLVIDAEKIQGELRWRLLRRRDPEVRSSLHEVIDSGFFVLVAPTHLRHEIEEHLADMAAESGRSIESATEEWKQLEDQIWFYSPRHTETDQNTVVDRDDLPYKYASEELGVPVYSRDVHFRKMKVPVVGVCLDVTARDHVRAASVSAGVTISSAFTVTIAIEGLVAFSRMIKSFVLLLLRLPKPLQFALAGIVAGLLIHPRSRAKLLSGAQAFCNKAAQLKPQVLHGLAELAEEYAEAHNTLEQTRELIRSAMPSLKRTVLMHAHAALISSDRPLSVGELEGRIRRQGYVPRSQNFRAYLRRVLRKSDRFLEAGPGLWSLRTA